MKTQKLNQKSVTSSGVAVVALVAGFMAGGAISAAVPSESRDIARYAIAGAGVAGGALVKDTDTVSKAVKFAALGAGAREVYGLVTDQLKKTVTVKADATMIEKAGYGAIGLACPCDYSSAAQINGLGNAMIIDTVYDERANSYNAVGRGGSRV